jgi:hypothetical protein
MISERDEGKGLVKVYWKDVRKRILKVEPVFAKIVDELSVDNHFPLYLAYYPYGALKGDTFSTFFPMMDGGYYRLNDINVPKDVSKHLGYSRNGAPLALLLNKNLELFIDLKDEGITIPRILYTPGSFFPFARILSGKSDRTYAPNGVLTLTSGARSTFMLPNIGCATNHVNLQRDFNIQSSPPKSLYEHWGVFKEIINTESVNSDWRSCLLYFSQNWLDKLYTDKAWLKLKLYLHELAWQYYEYQRNDFYYDIAFSVIQKKRNLKPNPYLADTARHLFTIALGAAPGFVPACNNDSLPVDILQKIFVESYGLKKYFPTIFHLAHFNFERDKNPIYYSLQHPSTHVFSPKSRKVSSTLTELRELEHITRVFTNELAKDNVMCSDTIIGEIANNIEFNYFHNKVDRHRVIQSSAKIPSLDKRFVAKEKKHSASTFACDAPFIRGCISIKTKS